MHLPPSRPVRPLASWLLAASLAWSGATLAAPAENKALGDFKARLASVGTLSDALKRDAAQGGVSADEVLAKVAAQSQEAQALAEAGEMDVARSILDDAYKLLAGALAKTKRSGTAIPVHEPASADPQGALAKRQQEFTRELTSTRALLDAYRRLDSQGAKKSEIAAIEKSAGDAEAAVKTGDLTRGEQLLHEAYGKTKAGIAALDGDGTEYPPATKASGPTPAELRHQAEVRGKETRALVDALKRLGKDKASLRIVADADARLARAAQLQDSDPQAALAEANEAYTATKIGLQALQKPSSLKSGSDAAPQNGPLKARQTEFDNRLQNVRLLRGTLVRLSAERKANTKEQLARADRLTAEAQRLAKDSLPLALATIDEAYAVIKQAVIATQATARAR